MEAPTQLKMIYLYLLYSVAGPSASTYEVPELYCLVSFVQQNLHILFITERPEGTN